MDDLPDTSDVELHERNNAAHEIARIHWTMCLVQQELREARKTLEEGSEGDLIKYLEAFRRSLILEGKRKKLVASLSEPVAVWATLMDEGEREELEREFGE